MENNVFNNLFDALSGRNKPVGTSMKDIVEQEELLNQMMPLKKKNEVRGEIPKIKHPFEFTSILDVYDKNISLFTKDLHSSLKLSNIYNEVHDELVLIMDRSKMSLEQLLEIKVPEYLVTEIEINKDTGKIKRIVYKGVEYK